MIATEGNTLSTISLHEILLVRREKISQPRLVTALPFPGRKLIDKEVASSHIFVRVDSARTDWSQADA